MLLSEKNILNEIKGLSEDKDMVSSEDYDAWLRIARISEKFQKIPDVLGFYWAGGGNVTNPNRTLKYIRALEKLYIDTTPDLGVKGRIFWLNYAKGRACFCLKDFKNANKHLSLNHWTRVPFIINLKTCWMLLVISLYRQLKVIP